jgi:hypothetical protein
MVVKAKKLTEGTTIWLTRDEYALLNECRSLFTQFTKAKISWGAYLCALSLGGLAAKSLNGIITSCPECGHGVVMTLENPAGKRLRKVAPGGPRA